MLAVGKVPVFFVAIKSQLKVPLLMCNISVGESLMETSSSNLSSTCVLAVAFVPQAV